MQAPIHASQKDSSGNNPSWSPRGRCQHQREAGTEQNPGEDIMAQVVRAKGMHR
jgi:hypothetical protein